MATTKEEVKRPAVKKVAKPKKATVADKAPAKPKVAAPKVAKSASSTTAVDRLVEVESKISALVSAIEADCKKGGGLTGLQRREHNKKLRAIADKLSSLLA